MNLMALLYVRQKLSPLQTAIDTEDSCINYRTLITVHFTFSPATWPISWPFIAPSNHIKK